MTECRSCGNAFERGPERSSDRLILCDSCFDDFVTRLKEISEGVERLRRQEDCSNECRECHLVLDMEDIVEGRNRCQNCEQTKQRIDYLLSAKSEEEADRRLEEMFGGVKKHV